MNKDFKITYLIGMPGVGKTYFGRYAASKLKFEFKDLDEEFIKKFNLSIEQMFEINGEEKFRINEKEVLEQLIRACQFPTIIALGGGTPCFNNTMERLKQTGKTVWLDSDLEYLYDNISYKNDERPMFKGLNRADIMLKLAELYGNRKYFYKQSDLKLRVYSGFSPDLFTNSLHLSTFAK